MPLSATVRNKHVQYANLVRYQISSKNKKIKTRRVSHQEADIMMQVIASHLSCIGPHRTHEANVHELDPEHIMFNISSQKKLNKPRITKFVI